MFSNFFPIVKTYFFAKELDGMAQYPLNTPLSVSKVLRHSSWKGGMLLDVLLRRDSSLSWTKNSKYLKKSTAFEFNVPANVVHRWDHGSVDFKMVDVKDVSFVDENVDFKMYVEDVAFEVDLLTTVRKLYLSIKISMLLIVRKPTVLHYKHISLCN